MEKIDDKYNANFLDWTKKLTELKDLPLSRRFFDKSNKKLDLHFFSDASLESMCNVAYLQAEDDDGADLLFVIRRCRVAPMKQQTISKLQLQAALCSGD